HIPEHRRNDEARPDIDDRNPDKVVFLQHLIFIEPKSAQEQSVGAGIEIAEIVGKIHDPGGGAVAPFDGHLMAVDEHAVCDPLLMLFGGSVLLRRHAPRNRMFPISSAFERVKKPTSS